MGKKINPLALRGVCKNIWFFSNKKERGIAVEEDYIIEQEVMKELGGLLCSTVSVSRIMKKIIVTIHTVRVGAVIGKNNERMERMKNHLSSLIGKPVIINVEELHKPELSASFISHSIADILVQRGNYRSVLKNFMKRALSAGAKGIRVILAGRIRGATIAKSELFQEGSMARQSIREVIDYVAVPALTRNGIVGVKTMIQL